LTPPVVVWPANCARDKKVWMPRRRSIRLAHSVYCEPGCVFSVTIATAPRSPVFADTQFGLGCIDQLRTLCTERRVRCYAYCLMPDHVHLLLGLGGQSDLMSIVGAWKSKCFLLRRRAGVSNRFWQRSFYDHALRREEDLLVATRYILENPIRAGLVGSAIDYPLSGSFEFHVDGLWPP
jgi:putative transposase